ncbi:MBL fold metallo-hydrolase RNA specificity domain-containing protein [Caulobacter sp.]|uniref:MBL fold metallo-hydrolase RNA specificity domain-containing protein n=1 Tax=Caulobacter sp. TaxID=78 RepID=UPI003BA93AB9
MAVSLTFHGAAECVTGFCARLSGEGFSILIDCGMFQGSKTLKALNYDPFPFDVDAIDAVLLTHAHIDHSGMLPKLMRAGYSGPIYATAPTRALCEVMLADAGEIQESEVFHLNRRNQQRGRPLVEAVYTARDAAKTMDLFETVKLDQIVDIAPGVRARYWNAGHMLGACSVEVILGPDDDAERILFSGDLGAGGQDYLPEPTGAAGVDHLVLESTYGNRERQRVDTRERRRLLAEELRQAHAAGGPLLMPTFAVGRAQELLLDILAVMESGDAPRGEIFLDSPLAIEATDVFLARGWNRDTEANPFTSLRHAPNLHLLMKPQESDQLEKLRDWHIILAGSGMCDAGRIRRHLKRLLWRSEVTVLISGFQAAGTLGRLLVDGKKLVRIQGDDFQVKARIRVLDVYSAHADANGLVRWAMARQPIRGQVFLAHGEPEALAGLAERLETAGFPAGRITTPALDDTFELTRSEARQVAGRAPRLEPGKASALDWHNQRADLFARLNARIQEAPTEEARSRLLRALEAALDEADGSTT